MVSAEQRSPLAPAPLQCLHHYDGCSAPALRFGTVALAAGTACGFSLGIEAQVRTLHASAWLRFAPPTCRMPLGQHHVIPRTDLEGSASPPTNSPLRRQTRKAGRASPSLLVQQPRRARGAWPPGPSD